MLLTNKKIRVTEKMVDDAGMTRWNQIGIPVDVKDPNKGLKWTNIENLTDDDFDVLEEYFLAQQPKQ